MEEDFFDLAIEGTNLDNQFTSTEGTRAIIFDTHNNYGSTYSSLDKLKCSGYITGLTFNCVPPRTAVSVEALPFLIRANSIILEKCANAPFGASPRFVHICNIFFISSQQEKIRLPCDLNDIVKAEYLDNIGKFYLSAGIRNGCILEFTDHLNNTADCTSAVYKAFIQYSLFQSTLLPTFGGPAFVYPIHGLSEISQCLALINSWMGCGYIINDSIKITEIENKDEYKYKFECDVGVFYSKSICRQNLIKKPHYVRYLNAPIEGCQKSFCAFVEADELMQVIGILEEAKVSPKGQFAIYFIKKQGPVTDCDISLLGVDFKTASLDIAFITTYDLEQFKRI